MTSSPDDGSYEIKLLQDAGLTALEAIEAATANGPDTLANLISQSLETFTTDKGASFPPGFSRAGIATDVQQLQQFQQFMSQMYRYRDANFDIPTNPNPGNFVNFGTLDCAEGWVLWMMGATDNQQYPLCGRANDTNVKIAIWAAPELAGNVEVPVRNQYFDFDETRLKDKDADGFPEYYPAYGGNNGDPYIYYPNTEYRPTYVNLDAQPFYFVGGPAARRAPLPYLAQLPNQLKQGGGSAMMVVNQLTFAEPQRFQVLAPGLDGKYLPQGAENAQSQEFIMFAFPDGPYTGQGINDTSHRDNITNFAGGTLESKMP